MKKLIIFLSIFILMVSFSFGALTDGLVHYYPLNNLTDVVSGRNMALTGSPVVEVGKIGNAYNFTTNGQYLKNYSTTQYQNLTMSVWFKTTGIGGFSTGGYSEMILGSNGWNYNDTILSARYSTIGGATGNITSQLNLPTIKDVRSSVITANNVWYHVVYVINGYNGTSYLYVNGTLNATQTGFTSPSSFKFPLRINGWDLRSDDYFQGLIDEVGYWNRTLTASEVNLLWNSGIGLTYPFTITSVNTLTYPENQTTYNNFNGSILIATTNNITCSINNSLFTRNSTTPNIQHIFKNNTNLSDLNYSIYVNCSEGNNLTFWFIKDTSTPLINNISIVSDSSFYMETYNLSFSVSDNFALWEIKTFINGSVLNETITNISLNTSVSTYNYSRLINFTSLGNYTFNYTVSDAHTDLNIMDKLDDSIETPYSFATENGLLTKLDNTEYLLKYPKNLTLTSVKTVESINYNYTNIGTNKSLYYTIESATPINYLKNSKYKCHFIINTLWHDCEGLNNVSVVKISEYKYQINFILDSGKSALEKSTGILNTVSYIGYYNIIATPTATLNVTVNVNVNVSVNVTNNVDVDNSNYNYNNVSINNTLNVNNTVSLNNTLNVNNTLNFTNTNNINVTTNYTINVNITTPSSSLSTDVNISNIYMTFIFLFLIYVLMFIMSFKLNTKIGLLMTFIVGIFLGVYFVNKISGVYALVGIVFIIINAYFFTHTAILKK